MGRIKALCPRVCSCATQGDYLIRFRQKKPTGVFKVVEKKKLFSPKQVCIAQVRQLWTKQQEVKWVTKLQPCAAQYPEPWKSDKPEIRKRLSEWKQSPIYLPSTVFHFLDIFLIGNIVTREAISLLPPRQYSKQKSPPNDLATCLTSCHPSAGVPATASRTLSYRSRQEQLSHTVFPMKRSIPLNKMTLLVGKQVPDRGDSGFNGRPRMCGNEASPGGWTLAPPGDSWAARPAAVCPGSGWAPLCAWCWIGRWKRGWHCGPPAAGRRPGRDGTPGPWRSAGRGCLEDQRERKMETVRRKKQ